MFCFGVFSCRVVFCQPGWREVSPVHFVRSNTHPDLPLSSSLNQTSVSRCTRYFIAPSPFSLQKHNSCPLPIAFHSHNQLFARQAWAVKQVQGRFLWYSKQCLKCGQGGKNRMRTKLSSLPFPWTPFLCLHLNWCYNQGLQ